MKLPDQPLHFPIQKPWQFSLFQFHRGLDERICPYPKEDLLLFFRGKQVQVHDLGKICMTYMTDSSELRQIGDLAGSDEVIESDREGHHLGDARHRSGEGCSGLHDCLGGLLARLELQFVRSG